ncbi:lccl domain protein [Anaeramoeba flamelloides]|uniref:Lccl domain protein n=1 Tax=Anaeramoeba flamelloides TaxID=1746091 RepID=A0AAV7YKE1_9EUKA|nr:lccl domain protein [Anaeramoeba flamelloides]
MSLLIEDVNNNSLLLNESSDSRSSSTFISLSQEDSSTPSASTSFFSFSDVSSSTQEKIDLILQNEKQKKQNQNQNQNKNKIQYKYKKNKTKGNKQKEKKNLWRKYQDIRLFRPLSALFTLLIIFLIHYVSLFIPSTRIAFKWYDNRIQWSKFVSWILMGQVGYMFVAGVNKKRRNPCKGRGRNGYKQFRKLFFVALIVFWFSPVWVIAGKDDKEKTVTNKRTSNILIYNTFCLGLSYLLGLHFSHIEIPFIQRIAHKIAFPERWKKFNKRELILVMFVLIVCITFASINFWYFSSVKYPIWYIWVPAWTCIFVIISIISCFIKSNYELHLHHYFVFLMLMVLVVHQNYVCGIGWGISFGIYVEGVSNWSLANLWDKR